MFIHNKIQWFVNLTQSIILEKGNNTIAITNEHFAFEFQVIRARFGAPAHITLIVFAFVCMALVTGLVMTEGTRVLTSLTDGKCF